MCLFFAVVAPVCVIFAASPRPLSPLLSPRPSSHCPRVQGVHEEPEPSFPQQRDPGSSDSGDSVPSIPASPANTGTNLGWHSVSIFKQRWVHYKHPPPTWVPRAVCVSMVSSASCNVWCKTITICLVNDQKKVGFMWKWRFNLLVDTETIRGIVSFVWW